VDELRGARVVLRRAAVADAELLVGWHADPEVARYWDGETYTIAQMRARLGERDVIPYIVLASDEPIGYLQVWFDEEQAGLDMFLIPAARGNGYGPEAGRLVAERLIESKPERAVTVDPYLWNESAISAWRRAGFRPVSQHAADDSHTSGWLLMRFDPAPPWI
jgi:RimJ/RimL family protein N-acetyltransferase